MRPAQTADLKGQNLERSLNILANNRTVPALF
jgi:hypothetical protein